VISVLPGSYAESIVLRKPCTIAAEQGPGTVVVVAPAGSAFALEAEDATLSGLTLASADLALATVDVPFGQLRLNECEIRANAGAALYVRGSGTVTMQRCHVENPAGAGVIVVDSAKASIDDTTFKRIDTTAVVVRGSAELELRESVITDVGGNGVCGTEAARVKVTGCTVSRAAGPAIAVEQRGQAVIRSTNITNTLDIGLLISGETEVMLADCHVDGAGAAGIVVAGAANPQVLNCGVTAAGSHACCSRRTPPEPMRTCGSPPVRAD
jgi:hypothetical protein